MLIVLLTGCGAEGEAVQSPDKEQESLEASPWDYAPEEETEGSDIDLDAVAAGLEQTMDFVLQYNGALPITSYLFAMESSDEYCPYQYSNEGNSFWYGGCTSEQGITFDGYLFYDTFEDQESYGNIMSGSILNGAASTFWPDGSKARTPHC